MKRAACFALGLALLAGCGGGGGSAPVTVPPATNGNAASADVTVVIQVPRNVTATGRTVQYVSSGTANVNVTVGALNASAPCVSPATTCSVSIAAPLGSDSFTVTLTDGSANVLATGTTVFTVLANVLNTVPLTFNGVIHTLNLSFSSPTITQGAVASSTLTIVAKDAAGITILQPGNYTAPVTVTTSPALPSAFALVGATTIGTIPASNSTIAVNYDGTLSTANSIVFTATSGSITGTATLTVPATSGVSLSPSALQFTTVPASPQTVTISEANYAGTFSNSAPGCTGIATIGTISSGHFNVTPLAVGTCTVTTSDTLGGSHNLTVNVATTSLTGS